MKNDHAKPQRHSKPKQTVRNASAGGVKPRTIKVEVERYTISPKSRTIKVKIKHYTIPPKPRTIKVRVEQPQTIRGDHGKDVR